GRWRTVAGTAMALLLVGWIGLYQVGAPVWVPWAPDSPDKAKAVADAEAKRRAAETEQQRLAAVKAEEERKAKAAAEAEARAKAGKAEKRRPAAEAAEELVARSSRELAFGDNDRAIATASEAIRLNPTGSTAFINRGVAYSRNGDNDRAIT